EIDAFWRDRLKKPLVIDRIDRAAAIRLDHHLIDKFLERRIIAPQHDAVGLDRKSVGGDQVILRRLRAGHHTVEPHVVYDEGGCPPSLHHQERLGMLLGGEDVEIETLLSVDFDELLDVGRSRQETMVLPRRSSTVLRWAAFLDTKRFDVIKCVMVKET